MTERRSRTAGGATSTALPCVVGAAKYVDPLPKHRRGTALPCFPLIDDGLSRGTHPGREPRLTQAQTPAHGPDADVVVDRHRRPRERRTTIGWADCPPIVRLPKRPGRGGSRAGPEAAKGRPGIIGYGRRPSRAAARSVFTCTPISNAITGNGRSAWSSRCVASARARASIFGGVARRPASHVRYDSGDTPSMAANAARDWPNAIRHSRSVRGSTTSHHAIGTGRRQVRDRCWAYFSQPILEGDRSLFSPAPSPPVPRQRGQSANSLGKWHARQDSNLRPSA